MQTQTDAELLAAARRIIAAAAIIERPKGLPPGYHGPVDLAYVRGSDVREFPKMVYKACPVSKSYPDGYRTRIVTSKEAQEALPNGWLVTTEEISGLLDPIAKAKNINPDDAEPEVEAQTEGKQLDKRKK